MTCGCFSAAWTPGIHKEVPEGILDAGMVTAIIAEDNVIVGIHDNEFDCGRTDVYSGPEGNHGLR